MKRDILLCPWATATVLMLCTSPAMPFALSVRQMRLVRFSCHPNCYHEGASFSSHLDLPNHLTDNSSTRFAGAVQPRRRLRRGRPFMLDADHREHSRHLHFMLPHLLSQPSSSSLLPTAIDIFLPFGRLVGVELPKDLSLKEAMRAAEAELVPEELDYCSTLHPTMQVGHMEICGRCISSNFSSPSAE